MRPLPLLCLGVSASILLVAAGDLFAQLNWKTESFQDTCFRFVEHPDRLPALPVTPAMRALAVVQRKSAVEAIGAQAKAYYASEAFKKRWAEHRAKFVGDEAQEAQKAQWESQGRAQEDQALKQMEAMIPMMPPAQQEEMKKALAKAQADKAKRSAKAKKGEPADGAPPKDYRVNLRKALENLLRATEGVDYGAATQLQDGKKRFLKPDYEAKPDTWKMCFRAGREATEGARTYAKAWLVEIK